ncbi:MAG TPA: archaetidylserine decarboxylase [bacterium]
MNMGLLRLLPLSLLSRVVGWAARRTWPPWLLQPFLRAYASHYGVALEEAELPLAGYHTVEAFFTRRLRAGLRPAADAALVSPCDGTIRGPVAIREQSVIQAKGSYYSIRELLGPLHDWGQRFEGGRCLTLYLSPRDYHRYHAPAAMTVRAVAHIPGRRWPVNDWATRRVPALFLENERAVAVAETGSGWPLAMVFVAALNVGRIHLRGLLVNGSRTSPARGEGDWRLAAGEEMGWFGLGSTILLLLPKEAPDLRAVDPGEVIRVGSALAPWPPERRAPLPPSPPRP